MEARESRALQCRVMAVQYSSAVICVTLRIPGPVKDSPSKRTAVLQTLSILREAIMHDRLGSIRETRFRSGAAGPEAFLAVRTDDVRALKILSIRLEEQLPWGPVLDLDLFVLNGDALTPFRREEVGASPRSCLICGNHAFFCIAERRHSLTDLVRKAESYLEQVSAGSDDREARYA
ncbi:MAG: citrate lyase holo-[acyl-carrier protein] synthase [Rectinema sp.]|nr:citrate lyase holo-[acyl-carrier protein] synthase [Rectinema sp.]